MRTLRNHYPVQQGKTPHGLQLLLVKLLLDSNRNVGKAPAVAWKNLTAKKFQMSRAIFVAKQLRIRPEEHPQ
jgi:hypothetical protein